MSGGKISVDIATMQEIANKIRSAAEGFITEIGQQKATVENMKASGAYDGKAADAYIRVFDDLSRDFKRFVDSEIHGIAKLLQVHTEKWAEMDQGLVVK